MGLHVTPRDPLTRWVPLAAALLAASSLDCEPESPAPAPPEPSAGVVATAEGAASMRPPSVAPSRRRNRETEGRQATVAAQELLPRYQDEMIDGAAALYGSDAISGVVNRSR